MDRAEALTEFELTLEKQGLHEALRFLNNRTPHRYTGIYRYDGSTLRNEHLVDAFDRELRKGPDVPIGDAYCAIVGATKASLVFTDARADGRFDHKAGSPVVSYCGVLLRDDQGEPFGTLCHYDLLPCQETVDDIPLLEAAAPLVWQVVGRQRARSVR